MPDGKERERGEEHAPEVRGIRLCVARDVEHVVADTGHDTAPMLKDQHTGLWSPEVELGTRGHGNGRGNGERVARSVDLQLRRSVERPRRSKQAGQRAGALRLLRSQARPARPNRSIVQPSSTRSGVTSTGDGVP